MVKVMGSIMVIASMTGIGFFCADGLKKKHELLEAVKTTAFLLHGNIKYSNSTLPEALEEGVRKQKGVMNSFLNKLTERLKKSRGESFQEIWKGTLYEEFTEIDENEERLIIRLGEILMCSERQLQLAGLEGFIKQLEAEIELQSAELKQKCYLYRMLGALSGIFIVVVAL